MLRDGYIKTGRTMSEFFKETETMSDVTHLLDVKHKDIVFLSYCSITGMEKEDAYPFFVLDKDGVENFLAGNKLKLVYVKKESDADLLKECIETTQLIAIIEGEKHLVSDYALPTLSIRASIGGDKTLNRNNFIRNLHIADAFFSKTGKTHIVYRKNEKTKKIFAFLGSVYTLVKQEILNDIINYVEDEAILGAMTVRSWSIDHRFTSIYLEFPECAEDFKDIYGFKEMIVPGLYLSTSDTGSCSMIAKGTYRIKESTVVFQECAKKHTSNLTVEDVIDMVDGMIFTDVRKLPETLVRLMVPILDYTKVDVSTAKGQLENQERISELLMKTMEKAISCIGKKKIKTIHEQLMAEISFDMKFSVYDMAMFLMTLPERISGLDRETLSQLQEGCGKVPYIIEKIYSTLDKKITLM